MSSGSSFTKRGPLPISDSVESADDLGSSTGNAQKNQNRTSSSALSQPPSALSRTASPSNGFPEGRAFKAGPSIMSGKATSLRAKALWKKAALAHLPKPNTNHFYSLYKKVMEERKKAYREFESLRVPRTATMLEQNLNASSQGGDGRTAGALDNGSSDEGSSERGRRRIRDGRRGRVSMLRGVVLPLSALAIQKQLMHWITFARLDLEKLLGKVNIEDKSGDEVHREMALVVATALFSAHGNKLQWQNFQDLRFHLKDDGTASTCKHFIEGAREKKQDIECHLWDYQMRDLVFQTDKNVLQAFLRCVHKTLFQCLREGFEDEPLCFTKYRANRSLATRGDGKIWRVGGHHFQYLTPARPDALPLEDSLVKSRSCLASPNDVGLFGSTKSRDLGSLPQISALDNKLTGETPSVSNSLEISHACGGEVDDTLNIKNEKELIIDERKVGEKERKDASNVGKYFQIAGDGLGQLRFAEVENKIHPLKFRHTPAGMKFPNTFPTIFVRPTNFGSESMRLFSPARTTYRSTNLKPSVSRSADVVKSGGVTVSITLPVVRKHISPINRKLQRKGDESHSLEAAPEHHMQFRGFPILQRSM